MFFAVTEVNPRLLMDASGDVKIYTHRSSTSTLVRGSFWPGSQRAPPRWSMPTTRRSALQTGKSNTEAIQAAKSIGAFSGEPLRSNLINQLNHWGFHRWFGLSDSADLYFTSPHTLDAMTGAVASCARKPFGIGAAYWAG